MAGGLIWTDRVPEPAKPYVELARAHLPAALFPKTGSAGHGTPATPTAGPPRGAAPPVAVVLASAETRDVPVRVRTIGFAEPIASVAIKTRTDSLIVEQLVRDGQTVAPGDLLFRLDDREARAQVERDRAQLERDRAILDRTRADLARKRDLVARGAATPQQVDQAISDEAAAAASVRADEAALALDEVKLSYMRIVSPIAGRVGTITVTPGNIVRSADPTALATITQISPIRVTFPLPERELPALREALARGEKPAVRAFVSGRREPIATGTVAYIESLVDVNSGTITVKAIFENAAQELWPNQYLDIDVEMRRLPGASVVPSVAVQPGQQGPFVYVAKADQTVEIRRVRVGVTEGDRAAIVEGLAGGERVVVDGQARLVGGARVVETGRGGPGQRPPGAPGAPGGQRAEGPAPAGQAVAR